MNMANDPAMRGGIQNYETGEVDYFYEEQDATTYRRINFDAETGEPENSKIAVRFHKKKSFQIPRELLRRSEEDCCEKPSCSKKPAEYNPFDKEAFIRMDGVNKDIVLGFTKSSYLLFLIPSVFCFTKMTSLIIAVFESLLHALAHYKNRKNTNSHIFYRSPLHVLTSQFCSYCRAENEMDLISRHHKMTSTININFKDMTKVIG